MLQAASPGALPPLATPNTAVVAPVFWVALAIAGIGALLLHRGDGARTARWLALLAAGTAAMLQLTAAGPLIRYQHFLPLAGGWTTTQLAALTVLGLQAALVLSAVVRRGGGLLGWVRARWSGGKVAVLGLALVGMSATLSASPRAYGQELLLAGLAQLLQLITLGMALEALPARWAARAAAWFDGAEAGRDPVPLLMAALSVGLSALLAVLVYERHPHIPDEAAYLLQARTFARGALTLPTPPVLPAFDVDITLNDHGRWFSAFPPGWPAILALGALVRAEWLVNPLLGGLNVLLAYAVTRRLYDRRTARVAALLLAASPWHLFLAMSFMSQTVTLTVGLLAALGVVRWRQGDSPAWLVLAGAAAGWAGLTRPLDGVLVAGATGLWLLLPGDGVNAARARLTGAVAYGTGMGLTGALTLLYNRALTGSPLKFPVMLWSDRVYGPGKNALGFGPDRGFGWTSLDPFPGHGWKDVLVNANLNTFQVNTELLGWGTGSLLLVVAYCLLRRIERRDLGLLLATFLVVGLHAFYWFSGGPDFGARYWFLVIYPLVALAARAVLAFEAGSSLPGRPLAAVLLLSVVTLLVFLPWRALDKYWHYRRMRPGVAALADSAGFGRSLVLVQGIRFPDYAGAATFNPLDLQANQPLYAFDADSTLRAGVLAAYPERPVWVIEGPSRTGGPYRIVAGPFPPGAPVTTPIPRRP